MKGTGIAACYKNSMIRPFVKDITLAVTDYLIQ